MAAVHTDTSSVRVRVTCEFYSDEVSVQVVFLSEPYEVNNKKYALI